MRTGLDRPLTGLRQASEQDVSERGQETRAACGRLRPDAFPERKRPELGRLRSQPLRCKDSADFSIPAPALRAVARQRRSARRNIAPQGHGATRPMPPLLQL